MKSIAIFNNKGGVGKTTFLCNLASFLALEKKYKVLVVDTDPQCNATQNMFSESDVEKFYESKNTFTVHSIIRPLAAGKGFLKEIETHKSEQFGVDVLLGDPKLSLTEDLLAKDWSEALAGSVRGLRTSLLFQKVLNQCSDYDFVIFDMGPSLGSINRAILISAEFFVTPMSIDIFSLKAAENISQSLKAWKRDLEIGLERVQDPEELDMSVPKWNLRFAGYITQQYTAKISADGNRRAVHAFDRILRQVPRKINDTFVEQLQPEYADLEYDLGSIPNLHSLIPLSQTSRRPIFALKAADGVVGAHFTKVKEYRHTISGITDRLLHNIAYLEVMG
jgi:cellulose biosynthesis protein BcsQ